MFQGTLLLDQHLMIYRLGINTISKIVRIVCHYLWLILKDEFLPQPTKENWQAIANGFKKTAHKKLHRRSGWETHTSQ